MKYNITNMKQMGRVSRKKSIPAIRDKSMNWSYAVQRGE